MPIRTFIMAAMAFTLLLTAQCRFPEPSADDVERVKQEFLILRFHAPTIREFSRMTDMELFEKSCQSKRVRCDKVLQILKEKDASFYETLTRNASAGKEGKP